MRQHILGLLTTAVMVAAACAVPSRRLSAEPAVLIPRTTIVLDLPEGWRPGGLVGGGILLSFIGSGDGYPRFAVTTDPAAEPVTTTDPAELAGMIEELFAALVAVQPSGEVLDSGWATVNGLHVHISSLRWPSVAGPIQARRLLLAHAGRFYILDWIGRAATFPTIAESVEASLRTLRWRKPGDIVAAR